jgi:hypothetical protein
MGCGSFFKQSDLDEFSFLWAAFHATTGGHWEVTSTSSSGTQVYSAIEGWSTFPGTLTPTSGFVSMTFVPNPIGNLLGAVLSGLGVDGVGQKKKSKPKHPGQRRYLDHDPYQEKRNWGPTPFPLILPYRGR